MIPAAHPAAAMVVVLALVRIIALLLPHGLGRAGGRTGPFLVAVLVVLVVLAMLVVMVRETAFPRVENPDNQQSGNPQTGADNEHQVR